jgi:hypothetical protein
VTRLFIDWEDPVLTREETTYDRYFKTPDTFKATFVGPVRGWGGKRKGAGRPKKIIKEMQTGLTVVVKLNNIQLEVSFLKVQTEAEHLKAEIKELQKLLIEYDIQLRNKNQMIAKIEAAML